MSCPSVADVLLGLVEAGAVLWVDGDRLRYLRLSTRDPSVTPDTRVRSGSWVGPRVRGQITALVAA